MTVDGGDPVRVQTGRQPADVVAAYPGLGPLHGFSAARITRCRSASRCAWGVKRLGLLSRLLACQNFNNPPNEPIGNVDGARPLSMAGCASRVGRSTTTTSPISTVLRRRALGRRSPVRCAQPDVADVYLAYGPNHGFDVNVNTGPGLHWACISEAQRRGPEPGERPG